MILREKLLHQGMKPGFWTGVIAFMLAKVVHLGVTFLLGLILGYIAYEVYGYLPDGLMTFVAIVDSTMVGLIFLIIVTRWMYKELIKSKVNE